MDTPETVAQTPAVVLIRGNARIEIAETGVSVNGTHVPLEPQLLRLMHVLAQTSGRRLDKHALLRDVGSKSERSNACDTMLTKIRTSFAAAHPDAGGDIFRSRQISCWIPATYFAENIPTLRVLFEASYAGTHLRLYEGELVLVHGEQLLLTHTEHQVLLMLARHADKVCTKEMLLVELYGANRRDWRDHKIIDVYICKLRKKLRDADARLTDVIDSAWGRGWMLRTTLPDAPTGETPTDSQSYQSGSLAFSLEDLPQVGQRWVLRRKQCILVLLEQGAVTKEYILERYPDLSEAELEHWRTRFTKKGPVGLKVSKLAA